MAIYHSPKEIRSGFSFLHRLHEWLLLIIHDPW